MSMRPDERRTLTEELGRAQRLFGPPAVSIETMLDWTADWVARDMASLGKATKFEVRDGRY